MAHGRGLLGTAGPGRELREGSGRRPPPAPPAKPIADPRPASAGAAGADPLSGWAGRGEGKGCPEWGPRAGEWSGCGGPEFQRPQLFSGHGFGARLPRFQVRWSWGGLLPAPE